MAKPFYRLALFIGLRYTWSRRSNRFISVVSGVSMFGMALGVASLIVVLSVMNGFAGELRNRILSVVPHVLLAGEDERLEDWDGASRRVHDVPGVLATAPYIRSKVMLRAHNNIVGARVTAVEPERESGVSLVSQRMVEGEFAALNDTRYGIVLGSLLLNSLAAQVGDRVEMVLPRLQVTPLGVFPRRKTFEIIGVFEIGAQLDGSEAFIALNTGQRLFGLGDKVQGLRVRLADLHSAPVMTGVLENALGEGSSALDWSKTQGSLFQSIKMEKVMIGVLLMCVIGVAAFNIISTLSMAVAEKRGDIAVLRTMGARSSTVVAIFMIQGIMIAFVGIMIGALGGMLLASYVSSIASFFESILGVQVFDPEVYFISRIPSELQSTDVLMTCLGALLLSISAASYPAWRASRVAPAEVMRYAS